MKKSVLFTFLLIFVFTLVSPIIQHGGIVSPMITAYAATEGTGGLSVEENENGDITIKPGQYPSLNGDLNETVKEANEVLGRYKMIGNFFLACILLGLMALLILNISKFAGSGSDDRARKQAMSGILFCGISIAIIGGLSIIANFAIGLF